MRIDDERYTECPTRLVTAESTFWLSVYRHYTNGILLTAGALLDQPAAYLDAMAIIESELAAIEKAKADGYVKT